ncbi:MAG: hypothetical protein HYZ53_22455 [Planctomycetes bacterium]|nr:hypothetical protein [Planctomycetota bacterium]
MYWPWWLAQFPLPILAFVGFRRLAARRPGLALAFACPLLPLALACAFRYVPEEVEGALFPAWPYIFFQQAWLPLGLLACVGAVWGRLPSRFSRGLAGLLAVFALGLHLWDTKWMLEGSKDDVLKTAWDKRGVCVQSSEFSCGAAAAVMVARRHGVEASEAEMAALGWTNEHKGTRMLGIAHALAAKLPGRRVRFRRLTLDELAAGPLPAIVELRLKLFQTHKVVVTRIADGYVESDDPASGKDRQSVEWFVTKWQGYAITVE